MNMKKSNTIASLALGLALISSSSIADTTTAFSLNAKDMLSFSVKIVCSDVRSCMGKRQAAQAISYKGRTTLKINKNGSGYVKYKMRYKCDADCMSDPQAFISSVNR